MTKVLFCTGKKKRVKAVLDYYLELENAKKIEILSHKIQTKKALFFAYDELRLLFTGATKDGAPLKLLQAVEYYAFRDQALVLMDFESPMVSDEMLKVKVLTLCHPYIAKGVRCKVTLKVKKETEFRVFYQVYGQLKGPVDSVLACRDQLASEKLLDRDKTSFVF